MYAVENIMEQVCDCCHWPYVEDEGGLERRCAECTIERDIRQTLTSQASKFAVAIADSFRAVLQPENEKER